MGSDRVSPFSNGSQFTDWESRNCDVCAKSYYNNECITSPCDIDEALSLAYLDDGTVSADAAERMGHTRFNGRYNWPCLEFEPLANEKCNDTQRKRIANRQESNLVVGLQEVAK